MAEKKCTCCSVGDASAYETALAFAERTTVRLWIVVLVLVFLLVATNIGWFIYENQFETVESAEISQDAENGTNNYIGNNGDITNGFPNN